MVCFSASPLEALVELDCRTFSGQINVQRAVDMRTLVSPPQLLLNDTAFFVPSHTVTLQNLESSSVTYTFSYQNARTIATYNNVRLVPLGDSGISG